MKYNLPKGWKKTTINNQVDLLGDGLHGTPDYDENGEYYFINGRNLKGKIIFDDKTKRVTYKEHMKYKKELNERTIFLSINGTIGNIAYYNNEKVILGKSACYMNIKKDTSKDFIKYILKDKNFINYSANYATGTTIKNLGLKIIREFTFNLPSLTEQRAVASTLTMLDNKIELNNKVNKNLEEQAQAIFKHWFVDFEFPNEDGMNYKSSGGEMVESEYGLTPKGWSVDKLGKNKLGNLMKSGIKEFSGEKIYLATADVAESDILNEDVKITFDERPSRANMQPRPNTLWFAKMKESRKLILVEELNYELQNNYIFSTGFAGLQASEDSIYYLWTYLESESFDTIKNSLCTGTTMQGINNSNINRINIVIPSNEILNLYNQIVKPMFRKITINSNENRKLVKLRDTLLPKLMSGEIRIPLD